MQQRKTRNAKWPQKHSESPSRLNVRPSTPVQYRNIVTSNVSLNFSFAERGLVLASCDDGSQRLASCPKRCSGECGTSAPRLCFGMTLQYLYTGSYAETMKPISSKDVCLNMRHFVMEECNEQRLLCTNLRTDFNRSVDTTHVPVSSSCASISTLGTKVMKVMQYTFFMWFQSTEVGQNVFHDQHI